MSSKILLESGYSQYQAYRHTTYQPDVEQPYFSPGWYTNATHQDTVARHHLDGARRAATTT